MVIYKRMAGKRQETIPLLAGTGIPLTATGLALLCSSYYVLIGEQCSTQFELNGGDFRELYNHSWNTTTIPESKVKVFIYPILNPFFLSSPKNNVSLVDSRVGAGLLWRGISRLISVQLAKANG